MHWIQQWFCVPVFAGLTMVLTVTEANASWEKVTQNLPDNAVRAIVTPPGAPEKWYVGGRGNVYVSTDEGKQWKSVLKLKLASSEVRVLYIPGASFMYAGTDEGLYRGNVTSQRWERIFSRYEEKESQVTAIAGGSASAPELYVGTSAGLFWSKDGGAQWFEVPLFKGAAIDQLQCASSEDCLVSMNGTIYRGSREQWQKIYQNSSEIPEPNETVEFAMEEIPSQSFDLASSIYFWRPEGKPDDLWFFEPHQILHRPLENSGWEVFSHPRLDEAVSPPVGLGSPASGFVFSTSRGVRLYSFSADQMIDLNEGLPDKRVYQAHYAPSSDALFLATEQGLFRLIHPELLWEGNPEQAGSRDGSWRRMMHAFDHEPEVQELQRVLLRYAEVHPEKIAEWRRDAVHSAWFPKLSFGYDMGKDKVVDLDRGGTGDADQFIIGPEEEDSGFSVDLAWELSDLIWNPEQMNIDNRSRLTVQLRDSLLNQLNQLYFARRRLQIESLLYPLQNVDKKIERQIRIEEYTAGIDALTGGYFSRALAGQ